MQLGLHSPIDTGLACGEVDLRIYPESPHTFTARSTGMAAAALRDIEGWLADHFTA